MITLKRLLFKVSLVLVGLALLFWLDAWLVGSLVMIGPYAKANGSNFMPLWLDEWVKHPLRSTRILLTGAPPAGKEIRHLWLLAQIPLTSLLGYLLYFGHRAAGARSPQEAAAYGSHGTAEFEPQGVLAKRFSAEGQGLILGRLQTRCRRRWLIHDLSHLLNQFVLLIGSAGTFKSTGYIIPNTLHEETTSLVIADPKGEIYRETAAVKEAQGYQVRVINYEQMHLSSRQNPLTYIRQPEDAVTAANVIIHNTENPNKAASGDDFFDMAEQALMAALILYVKLHLSADEQHLGSVLALGTELNQEELNAVFDALPREDPARRYYRTFRQAEDKTRACIMLGFANRLQLWNLQSVEALTATTDFDLAELGRERVVLYVIFPLGANAKPLFPLMALLWTQLCDELIKLANGQPTGRLPVPVRLRIDEAANIGYIPDLNMRVSTTRGLGIWWELVFQNLPQFKARYRTWLEIAGSCDTLLYYGSNDYETQEYISRRLGRTTIQIQSANESRTGTGFNSEGQGRSYTGRDLMTPDELARLEDTKAILMQRGRRPAIVTKAFFKEHPLADQIVHRHAQDMPPHASATYRVLNPQELPPVIELAARKAKAQTRRQHGKESTELVSTPPPTANPLAFIKKRQGG